MVIPNGIDTDEFSPSVYFEPYSVLFASRLDADSSRGAYCLCTIADELAAEYPQIKIRIAGGGSELSALRKSKRSVELLGGLPSLFEEICRAELVIGVSRVAFEAMSCERNVILFGNEGAMGLVDNAVVSVAEKTNFTCRGCGHGNEVLLKKEIERFFSTKIEKREAQAKQNREYVIKHHSSKDIVRQTLSVYEGLISRPRRILIGGYYGFKNMGDDAMLCALLKLLREVSINPSHVSVLGKEKKKLDGVQTVGRYTLVDLVREMKKADVFLLGGGSLFQNETSDRSLLYYCALVFLSKVLGVRCVLISNGLGPLESRFARALMVATLRLADHVSLRDKCSLELARSLGRCDATLGADLCFFENVKPNESERVRQIKSKLKNGYVMIALKGNLKDRIAFAYELKKLCGTRDWRPLFVVMDGSEDREKAKSLARLCGGIFAEDLTQEEIFALISSAKVTIGERLHFLIFSLLAGKGFVGVGVSPKIVSFASETLGMPTLDFADPSELSSLVDKAMGISPDILCSELRKYQNRLKKELEEIKKAFFV